MARVDIIITAKDLASKVAASVARSFQSIRTSINTAFTRAGILIPAAIFGLTKFAQAGERDINVTRRFKDAMLELGQSSDVVLARLVKATDGLVEQSEVMRNATLAMRDGGLTFEQTALAMEFMRRKAVATGQDVQSFLGGAIEGLARGNLRGLLVLFPDLGKELEKLADGGMEDAKKKAQVLNMVFERMAQALPSLQKSTDGAAVSASRFGVQFADAINDLQVAVAQSPATAEFFKALQETIEKLKDRIPEIMQSLTVLISALGKAIVLLTDIFGKAAEGYGMLIDAINDTPNTIRATGLAHQIEQALVPKKLTDTGRKNLGDFLNELGKELGAGGNLDAATDAQLQAIMRARALAERGGMLGRVSGAQGNIEIELARQRTRRAGAIAAPSQLPAVDIVAKAGPVAESVGASIQALEDRLTTLNSKFALGKIEQDAYLQSLLDIENDARIFAQSNELNAEQLGKVAGVATSATDAFVGLAKGMQEAAQADERLRAAERELTVAQILAKVDAQLRLVEAVQREAEIGTATPERVREVARAAVTAGEAARLALIATLPPGKELDDLLVALKEKMLGLGDATKTFGELLSDAFQKGTGASRALEGQVLSSAERMSQGLTQGFEEAFGELTAGSRHAGEAFADAMQNALADVAAGFGRFFLGKAIAEVAEGIATFPFGNQHFAAAAQYTAAAAAMFAVAGALRAGAAGGRGAGGGGGAGDTRQTEKLAEEREATIIVQGGILDMSDPRQADAFASAVETLTGRKVILKGVEAT